MSIGFQSEGRTCSHCQIEIPKHIYNQHLYCAAMMGCFNFCSEKCYQLWHDRLLKRVVNREVN
jgi:hypothetical protein